MAESQDMQSSPISDRGFRPPLPSDSPAHEVARILFSRYRAISGDHVPDNELFRTIVVVGAGASHAACGLPLGKTLADTVEKRVIESGIPQRLINKELNRLEDVYRLRRDDFETRLLALGRYDTETVLKVLCEECDIAHYPSLTYETLAHLMKHGFLDAILNFNFDELLDQAIDEEVGAERYTRIVRGGDWSRKLRADAGHRQWWFDQPLYIKPHGTVSDPASLRFTRDAYFTLPPDTARLLSVLISGAPASDFVDGVTDRQSSQQRPVCLLVLGHALESFELNKLLEKSPPKSRLYVAAFGNNGLPDPPNEWPRPVRDAARSQSIPIGGADGALDDLMLGVWGAIEQEATAEAKKDKSWMGVRGIVRHELIAQLFRPFRRGKLLRRDTSGLSDLEQLAIETYLQDRFVIEVMLAIAKAKGFVDLRELHRGRVGRFYHMLSDVARPGICRPVIWFLEQFGMKRRDSSSESYWHSNVQSASVIGDVAQPLTLSHETFSKFTSGELADACKRLLSPHRQDILKGLSQDLMVRALAEMFKGDEVEIAPARAAQYRFKFGDARVVRTFAELRRETILLMKGPWQLLLCVAESGEWLVHEEIRRVVTSRQRPVGVIVADTVVGETLRGASMIRVQQLPWHLHNRHMTIRLVGNETDGLAPDLAIYFERRYRSALISPVVVTAEADLERVMDDFTVYWLKAQRHQQGLSEVIAYSPEQLKQRRQSMLAELSLIGGRSYFSSNKEAYG